MEMNSIMQISLKENSRVNRREKGAALVVGLLMITVLSIVGVNGAKGNVAQQRMAPPLYLVCFWHRAGDEFTRRLHQRLNASGKLYLTHAMLNGRYTLRMAIGQTHTEAEHVERAWQLMSDLAADLQAQ